MTVIAYFELQSIQVRISARGQIGSHQDQCVLTFDTLCTTNGGFCPCQEDAVEPDEVLREVLYCRCQQKRRFEISRAERGPGAHFLPLTSDAVVWRKGWSQQAAKELVRSRVSFRALLREVKSRSMRLIRKLNEKLEPRTKVVSFEH